MIVLRASAHFDGHWLDYFGRDAAAVWVGIGDEAGTVSWGDRFFGRWCARCGVHKKIEEPCCVLRDGMHSGGVGEFPIVFHCSKSHEYPSQLSFFVWSVEHQ